MPEFEECSVPEFEEAVMGELRVRIDRTLCVGFGDCVSASPETFVLDAENVATFAAPASGTRESLLRACASCPVDALTVWTVGGEQLLP